MRFINGLGRILIGSALGLLWPLGVAVAAQAVPTAPQAPPLLSPRDVYAASVRRPPTELFGGPIREDCDMPANVNLTDIHAWDLKLGDPALERKVRLADMGWLGRQIQSPRDICALRDAVAARLFQLGIFARVKIPAQTIKPGRSRKQDPVQDRGVITLTVIRATLNSVTIEVRGPVEGSAKIKPANGGNQEDLPRFAREARDVLSHLCPEPGDKLRVTSPAPRGAVCSVSGDKQGLFDIGRIERFLLLANDIPGVRAVASLARPESTSVTQHYPGALDLKITVEPTDAAGANGVEAQGVIDNYGSKSLGPWSATARVDYDVPTSLWGFTLGDRTTFVAYSTLGNPSQRVVELIQRKTLNSYGLFAEASFAYGRSHPGDVLAPLDLRGQSYVGSLSIEDPILRRQTRTLSLAAGMDFVNQATDFPGGAPLADDVLRVAWLRAKLWGEHDFTGAIFGDFMTATGDLTFDVRKGLSVLGASRADAPALSRVDGGSDAFVARMDGEGALRIDSPLTSIGSGATLMTLSLRVQGQWADRPLLAYEQQGIGNLTIGRGYDPNATTGDRVIAGDFQVEFGPLKLGKRQDGWPVRLSPYAFFDYARVTSLETGSVDSDLRSIGGGVVLRATRYLRADLVYAKPLDRPYAYAVSKPPGRVMLQLVVGR